MNRFPASQRWTVTPQGPIAPGHATQVYVVERGTESYDVWADPIARTFNCTSCSGPLSAMKSGCVHCAAARRYLKREGKRR